MVAASVAIALDRGVSRWKTLTPRRGSSRAIAAISPALDPTIGIVVCIPCFRRPDHLRKTLQSLVDQRTDRRFAVVMVENDASACGSVPVANEFLRAGKLAGPLRGRAAARQLPGDQRGVRNGAGHLPRCGRLSDDRRRRDCVTGLAGADGASGTRRPAPMSSAVRCFNVSMTRPNAGCSVTRRFVHSMRQVEPCRSSMAAETA